MKTTLLLLTFLVGYGCAGMSFNELEDKALNCKPPESEECMSYQQRFESRLSKRNKQDIECPSDRILFKSRGRMTCISVRDMNIFTSPF